MGYNFFHTMHEGAKAARQTKESAEKGYDMGGPSMQQKQTIITAPSAALDGKANTTSVLPIVERGNFQVL